jgi:hypothetical protein
MFRYILSSPQILLTLAIASTSCQFVPSSLNEPSAQTSDTDCGRLRKLLRIASGGAVDAYEDDYASFIRSETRFKEFDHIPMDELVAIRAYTHRFWKDLNAALWNNTLASLPEIDRVVLDCAVAGLQKMAPYDQPVFRQTNLTSEVVDRHNAGKSIPYPAFTSTTTDPKVLEKFPGNTRFTISNAGGYEIAWLSEHAEESEVLIPPKRCFEVISRTPSVCPPGVLAPCWHIEMKGSSLDDCKSSQP